MRCLQRCLFCRLSLPDISSIVNSQPQNVTFLNLPKMSSKNYFIVNFSPQNVPFQKKISPDFGDCKWENITADFPIGKMKMLWNSTKVLSKKIILNKYSSEGVLVKCVLLWRFVKNPALTQITSQEVLSNFVFDKV